MVYPQLTSFLEVFEILVSTKRLVVAVLIKSRYCILCADVCVCVICRCERSVFVSVAKGDKFRERRCEGENTSTPSHQNVKAASHILAFCCRTAAINSLTCTHLKVSPLHWTIY